jgi:hypothetical protein
LRNILDHIGVDFKNQNAVVIREEVTIRVLDAGEAVQVATL